MTGTVRLGALALVSLAGCATPAAPLEAAPAAETAATETGGSPSALFTADGEPVVVVVETRDESLVLTAERVRDPSAELPEMHAPRVMADVDPALRSPSPAPTP